MKKFFEVFSLFMFLWLVFIFICMIGAEPSNFQEGTIMEYEKLRMMLLYVFFYSFLLSIVVWGITYLYYKNLI